MACLLYVQTLANLIIRYYVERTNSGQTQPLFYLSLCHACSQHAFDFRQEFLNMCVFSFLLDLFIFLS